MSDGGSAKEWARQLALGEPVRFGPSRESIFTFAITPIFVLLGIWGLFTGNSTLETVMSIVAIVVGALGTIRLLTIGRYLRTAALVVDKAGLHTRGTDLAWRDVAEIRLRGMGQGSGIMIVCSGRTVLTHTLRDATRASEWLSDEVARRGRPSAEDSSPPRS